MTGPSATYDTHRGDIETARRTNGQFGNRRRREAPIVLAASSLPDGVEEVPDPYGGEVHEKPKGSLGARYSIGDEYVTQKTWQMPDGTHRRLVIGAVVEAVRDRGSERLVAPLHDSYRTLVAGGLVDPDADGVRYEVRNVVQQWDGLLDDGDEHGDHGEMACCNRAYLTTDATWFTTADAAGDAARKTVAEFDTDDWIPGGVNWPLYSCGHNSRTRGCGGCDPTA